MNARELRALRMGCYPHGRGGIWLPNIHRRDGGLIEGLPPARTVPRTFTDDPHLVMIGHPESPLAERYRRIRLSLEHATFDFPIRPHVVVITSAAFSLWGVLAGKVPLDHALIEMSDSRLWVLPEGAPSERPLGIVRSEILGSLIEELRRRFDRIVIDTPPTVPFTDAAILAALADATLLVVRAKTTSKTLIRQAWASLSGTNVLGAVLNDFEFTAVDRYYNKYDDYEPGRYGYGTIDRKTTRD